MACTLVLLALVGVDTPEPSNTLKRVVAYGGRVRWRDSELSLTFRPHTDLSAFTSVWDEGIAHLTAGECVGANEFFLDATREAIQGLKSLSLAGSDLRRFPIGATKLEALYIPNSCIESYTFLRDLASLRVLDASGCAITTEDVRSLVLLENLRTLDLSGTEIDERSFSLLGKSKVSRLTLIGCGLRDRNCDALMGSKSLKTLVLGRPESNPSESGLSRLTIARFQKRGITVVGAPTEKTPVQVRTSTDPVGTAKARWTTRPLGQAIADNRTLQLDGMGKLTDSDVSLVCSGLKQLQSLDLRGARITDESLAKLASMPHLVHLDISDTLISDFGFDLSWKTESPLRTLLAVNTKVTGAGFDRDFMRELTHVNIARTGDIRWKSVKAYPTSTEYGLSVLAGLDSVETLHFGVAPGADWADYRATIACFARLEQVVISGMADNPATQGLLRSGPFSVRRNLDFIDNPRTYDIQVIPR